MKNTILIGLTTLAIYYLITSFILMDLNAYHWSLGTRFLFAWMSTVASVATSSIYYVNNQMK